MNFLKTWKHLVSLLCHCATENISSRKLQVIFKHTEVGEILRKVYSHLIFFYDAKMEQKYTCIAYKKTKKKGGETLIFVGKKNAKGLFPFIIFTKNTKLSLCAACSWRDAS